MITVWETGLMDYVEFDKPVNYTSEFLKDVASSTSDLKVTNEHSKEVIGNINNFVFEDDSLVANVSENVNLEGKGISPVFEFDLIDKGDYYVPVNGWLKECGLSKTPRSHITYNSIEEEEDMSNNEALETAVQKNKELEQEIGSLKNQIKQKDNLIRDQKNDLEKTEGDLKSLEDSVKELEEYKAKAEKFDNFTKTKKEELIKDIVGDNDKLKEQYDNDFSYEQLVTLKETMILNRDSQGAGYEGNPNVDDLGNQQGEPELTEDEFIEDNFDEIFKESGLSGLIKED